MKIYKENDGTDIKCDCESLDCEIDCEDYTFKQHTAGNCTRPALFKVTAWGITYNSCSLCLALFIQDMDTDTPIQITSYSYKG